MTNLTTDSHAGRRTAARTPFATWCTLACTAVFTACSPPQDAAPRMCEMGWLLEPPGRTSQATLPAPEQRTTDACGDLTRAVARSMVSAAALAARVGRGTDDRARPAEAAPRRVSDRGKRSRRSSRGGDRAPKRVRDGVEPRERGSGTAAVRTTDASGDVDRSAREDCIDVSSAPTSRLESLPGVGPSRAAKIVALRNRRGIARARDLRRIRGIGRATLAKMRPHLCPLPDD